MQHWALLRDLQKLYRPYEPDKRNLFRQAYTKKYRCVPGSGIPGSPVKYGPEEISQWERKKDLHDPEKQNGK